MFVDYVLSPGILRLIQFVVNCFIAIYFKCAILTILLGPIFHYLVNLLFKIFTNYI